jgi:hypothetical protein
MTGLNPFFWTLPEMTLNREEFAGVQCYVPSGANPT